MKTTWEITLTDLGKRRWKHTMCYMDLDNYFQAQFFIMEIRQTTLLIDEGGKT